MQAPLKEGIVIFIIVELKVNLLLHMLLPDYNENDILNSKIYFSKLYVKAGGFLHFYSHKLK